MRNAVERARPPAGVVPAVQRRPAGARRHATGTVAVECPVDHRIGGSGRRAAPAASRVPMDRGPPGRGATTPHRPATTRADTAVRVRPPVGLVEHFDTAPQDAGPEPGASAALVRGVLILTMVILGAAAFAHVVRYVLLLINRSTLLHPWVAAVATWLPVALSVAAMFAVVTTILVLTNWLIARRAASYRRLGTSDPRPVWMLWTGCVLPVVNLIVAPVFIFELAKAEDRLSWLRRPVYVFWAAWLVSHVISGCAFFTSFAREAQGIADNTVITVVAYLAALAVVVLVARVHDSFDRAPVERPARRWVVVPDQTAEPGRPGGSEEHADGSSAPPVEAGGQNPAA